MEKPDSFFFVAGGWGVSFYIGVVKALYIKWGKKYVSNCKIGGNSAGSVIALAVSLGYDFEYIEELWITLLNKSKNDIFFKNVSAYQEELINSILKHKDDYLKLNGKLFIGVTSYKNKYTIISEWKSNSDLKNSLFGSMYIPFYSKKIRIDNNVVLDGAFSQNYHKIADKTLVISVSQYGDILSTPPIKLIELSQPSTLSKYYIFRNRGYNSLINWDGKYNKIPIKKYHDKHLNILWTLSYMHDIKFFTALTVGIIVLRKLWKKKNKFENII